MRRSGDECVRRRCRVDLAHTAQGASPPLPHDLQIDLGAAYDVRGFRYLPRQNSQNGRIARYDFYTSLDGKTWNSPAAIGTFPDAVAQQQVVFTQRSARYVRLRALTEVAGRPFTSVAELNVLAVASTNPVPTPIPQTNWILRFVDSQETVGEDGAAANAFDGERASIWHTQCQNVSPPLPHEVQIDPGTSYTVAGFRCLPRQKSQNGRVARTSSTRASTGRCGAPRPRPARSLTGIQPCSGRARASPRQWNSVPPPDFYQYFSTHQSEYANEFEMNGIAYESMARLWRLAICPVLVCPNPP